jgi:hypothetical protein
LRPGLDRREPFDVLSPNTSGESHVRPSEFMKLRVFITALQGVDAGRSPERVCAEPMIRQGSNEAAQSIAASKQNVSLLGYCRSSSCEEI